FTHRTQLRDYRDTLEDERERLEIFLLRALERGVYALPDGRMYVSAAHTERDVDETLEALDAVLGSLEPR
ncbi:MAG: hypothetical protein ACPL88_03960, partial [Bryobacteraceae bacterium]